MASTICGSVASVRNVTRKPRRLRLSAMARASATGFRRAACSYAPFPSTSATFAATAELAVGASFGCGHAGPLRRAAADSSDIITARNRRENNSMLIGIVARSLNMIWDMVDLFERIHELALFQ